MAQYSMKLGNLGWRGRIGLVVVTAIGLAAAIALIILAAGIAIVLIPIVAAAFVIGRWRLKRMTDEAARQRPSGQRTIEIDYTVIDGKDRNRR